MTTETKVQVSKKTREDQERAEACDRLRRLFPAGSTVHTILRHVSKSGMQRRISVVAIEDGNPRDVSWLVAQACGYRLKDDAIVVGGCGMDMGFSVVYDLSWHLYRDGFYCLGKEHFRCPSNDHSNDRMLRPDLSEVSQYSPDRKHTEGGYALRHAWL